MLLITKLSNYTYQKTCHREAHPYNLLSLVYLLFKALTNYFITHVRNSKYSLNNIYSCNWNLPAMFIPITHTVNYTKIYSYPYFSMCGIGLVPRRNFIKFVPESGTTKNYGTRTYGSASSSTYCHYIHYSLLNCDFN